MFLIILYIKQSFMSWNFPLWHHAGI
jgi:hypothetical protein